MLLAIPREHGEDNETNYFDLKKEMLRQLAVAKSDLEMIIDNKCQGMMSLTVRYDSWLSSSKEKCPT